MTDRTAPASHVHPRQPGTADSGPTDDLDAIIASIWQRLTRGKADRRSPFHTPVVGTADGDLRVMVLRHVDAASGRLRFHTDARSPKTGVIGDGAPVSLLFYDPAAKVQLRCRGTGRIDTDGAAADAAWAASAPTSRRCYLAEAAPGMEQPFATSGLPAHVEGRVPDIAETEPGRAHFAILTVAVTRIDWLYLANSGHRRALFTRDAADRDAGPWRGCWLVP